MKTLSRVFKKCWGILVILALLLLLVPSGQTIAQSAPGYDMFYGTLSLDGSTSPAGITVTARVHVDVDGVGVICGTKYTEADHTYGTFSYPLLVQGNANNPINNGDTIYFFANGALCDQTATFESMSGTNAPTELNLTALVPYTSGWNPTKGSNGVDVNTSIVVHVRDDGAGVDESTIKLTVNGIQVDLTDSITGSPADYTVTYTPTTPFDFGQLVNVTVDAKDLASTPNTMPTDSYSFTTGSDTTPPYTSGWNPAKNAIGVSVSTNIEVHVKDDQTGVKEDTIKMTVNGIQVITTITGEPSDYTVIYAPIADFGYAQVVNITITATDLNSTPNVMPTDSYSFTTIADTISPYTSGWIPAKDATGVPINTPIVVHIKDAGTGVDQSTIEMRVGTDQVNLPIVTPAISGTSADYTLTYVPPTNFGYNQKVYVSLAADDLVLPPNNPNPMTFTYSFTTRAAPTPMPPPGPVISISPAFGPWGSLVTVTGSGFGTSETGIKVTFDGTTVVSNITASSGAWSTTFTVPSSSLPGTHIVDASGSTTLASSVTDKIFTIPSILMKMSPTSGSTGTLVTVAGAGFGCAETGITVTYDGIPAATGIIASSQGIWSVVFTVPASSPGNHIVDAYGSVTTAASVPDLLFISQSSIEVTRNLPQYTSLGTTFEVQVTFTSPSCGFGQIGVMDNAPEGWAVAVDKSWCTPPADDADTPNSNQAVYVWFNSYCTGTKFSVVYRVTVPADASYGSYSFSNGQVGYNIGGGEFIYSSIGGDWQIEVVNGFPINGLTYEVKGVVLPNVLITLIKGGLTIGTTISDTQGSYSIAVPEIGDYTLCASKAGYRDQTRVISIADLGQEYTFNFKGNYGLIPNAPDIWYLLNCAAQWKYQRTDTELRLDMWKLLDVAAAWKYPTGEHGGSSDPPCRIHGTVQVNGINVANGTVVTATVGGDTYTTTVPSKYGASTYLLQISQPGGKTYAGQMITFMIGSLSAVETATWTQGGNITLNLTIFGVIHTGLDINSKIGELVANEYTASILEKWIPGLTTNPQLMAAYGMTLKDIAPMKTDMFTAEVMAGIEKDLAAIK